MEYTSEEEWYEIRARIDEIRGTITSCDCLVCGKKNGMVYEDGVCFTCYTCNNSIAEDVVYLEVLGYDTSPIDE